MSTTVELVPGRFEVDDDGTPWLSASRCTACGRVAFPPRGACPRCRLRSMEPQRVGRTATLSSFTVCHTAPSGWQAPYLQAYVALEEGIRVFALVSDDVEPSTSALTVGEPMELVVEPVRPGAGVVTYKYRPLRAADA
ncbi:MAG TPA: OB-fold domain-containing protein [Solirubrobacteraceae bacterium]|nr:OB-fold domain-containing protein [Solirubrobacteraceae bacterium]